MALTACGGAGGAADVPQAVEAWMAAEFPADGQLHVRSKGKIFIKPKTMFCRAPRDIARTFIEKAPRFLNPGIDNVINADLGENVNGRTCADDGTNLVNYWQLIPNRAHQPYRLVLAVWQGDPAKGGAVWVGGVERTVGQYPENPLLHGLEGEPLNPEQELRRQIRNSINFDTHRLSNSFVSELVEAGYL